MEPTSNPNIAPQNPETQGAVQQTPESIEEAKVESAPDAQELDITNREAANQNAGMPLPPVVASPVTQQDDNAAIAAPVQSDNDDDTSKNPVTAEDVDIVEKQWVERAKTIVEETRDDPHRQEQEVEKLQMDYLKKRYGKVIKPGDAA